MQSEGALSGAGRVLTLTIFHVYGRHYLGTVPIDASMHTLFNVVQADDGIPMYIDNFVETCLLRQQLRRQVKNDQHHNHHGLDQ